MFPMNCLAFILLAISPLDWYWWCSVIKSDIGFGRDRLDYRSLSPLFSSDKSNTLFKRKKIQFCGKYLLEKVSKYVQKLLPYKNFIEKSINVTWSTLWKIWRTKNGETPFLCSTHSYLLGHYGMSLIVLLLLIFVQQRGLTELEIFSFVFFMEKKISEGEEGKRATKRARRYHKVMLNSFQCLNVIENRRYKLS